MSRDKVIGEDDIGPIFADDDAKDNSGPAFPVSIPGCGDNGWSGMTLRDYFAGQAIEGLVYGLTEADAKEAAESAYLIADALIEARKKQ